MSNRPTPSALRKLSGGNLHRINKREARFRKINTAEEALPTWLDDLGREEFQRLAPELIAQGLLDRGNIMLFAAGNQRNRFALPGFASGRRKCESRAHSSGSWTSLNQFNYAVCWH
jgi:hypothetical protein